MSKKQCWVCGRKDGMHSHHVIPRAYGGLDGPVVDLCGGHHTLIHTAALKKSNNARELEYNGHTEEEKARLRELVKIIRRARVMSKHMRRPITLQLNLDAAHALRLRELKRLLGANSLQQTVIRCINFCYSVKNVHQEKH